MIKHYTADQDKKGYGNETHDAALLCYAEVLLNLAEAKAELGTITQADRTFDESKHYLRPIPINVISKNPNLIQNPGWE